MREILFRAKGDNTGIWHYGYVERKCDCCSSVWVIHVPPENPEDKYGSYWVDPDTIGQYAGRTDKNGKKVFEGDIVRVQSLYGFRAEGTVYFADGAFRYRNEFGIARSIVDTTLDVEIIGNIYDNKMSGDAPNGKD